MIRQHIHSTAAMTRRQNIVRQKLSPSAVETCAALISNAHFDGKPVKRSPVRCGDRGLVRLNGA
jgi:hypothetical protein